MTEPNFSINDRRRVRRTAGGMYVGDMDREFQRLRANGQATMPTNNPARARIEGRKIADQVNTRGSLVDNTNRMMMAQMRRQRLGSLRTGANIQMALPKMRTPLGSLEDKDIPFNVEDATELAECRRWARAFYITHDLVPLLIDIYARFPLVGLEFKSDDKYIENVYSKMFLDDLDYENFLPDSLGREYYIAGEVTALAHFNESLGTISGEEILNPDMVRISKGLFVPEPRVQLWVKDLVDGLRDGPANPDDETRSEREQRIWEYRQLLRTHPEIVRAAQLEDGLDISPALWSRIVNQPAPWIDRGAPFLLRSFRTLMMEESLNAAQDAVADRLYSPMILATLGIENMGDGMPWIPEQADLDDLRDDMQSALAADFKLVAHHMGLKIDNVFGRESVPRFDQDYDRIDLKLMQAWGIGAALIMGGTAAAGTYASSALNREVCELLMKSFQKKVIRHIRQRMEIVAEAQEHYATEKKGAYRRPLYREVVQYNEHTGEEEIVRVPELLIPDVEFRTLNLRDEAQERQFMLALKNAGFAVSDRALGINTQLDVRSELKRSTEETVDKFVAGGEAIQKAQQILDEKKSPYPPELAQALDQTLILRQQKASTEQLELQTKGLKQQMDQQSPAGQVGALPGVPAMPPGPLNEDGEEEPPEGDAPPAGAPSPLGPPPMGGPMAGGESPPPDATMPPQLQLVGGTGGARVVHGPHASGPGVLPDDMDAIDADPGMDHSEPDYMDEPTRNRARPAESDNMRGGMPRAGSTKKVRKGVSRPKHKFEMGPSSYGHRRTVSEERVEAAIHRREARENPPTVEDLVNDSSTYSLTGMGAYERQLQADFPEIMAGEKTPTIEESKRVLDQLVDRYEQMTGIRPLW